MYLERVIKGKEKGVIVEILADDKSIFGMEGMSTTARFEVHSSDKADYGPPWSRCVSDIQIDATHNICWRVSKNQGKSYYVQHLGIARNPGRHYFKNPSPTRECFQLYQSRVLPRVWEVLSLATQRSLHLQIIRWSLSYKTAWACHLRRLLLLSYCLMFFFKKKKKKKKKKKTRTAGLEYQKGLRI